MKSGWHQNYAQIIPPEIRTGQIGLNGDLHVLDKVLLPQFGACKLFVFSRSKEQTTKMFYTACRAGDWEFIQGRAFASQISPFITGDGVQDNFIQSRGGLLRGCHPYNFQLSS